jgi:hypothetical protein
VVPPSSVLSPAVVPPVLVSPAPVVSEGEVVLSADDVLATSVPISSLVGAVHPDRRPTHAIVMQHRSSVMIRKVAGLARLQVKGITAV